MTTLRSPMHSSRWWAVAATTTCLLIASIGAGQAAKDQPTAGVKTLALFDGKSLDGWKKNDFPRAGDVKVEDGKINLNAGGTMTGITTTRQDLPRVDYELSYEAMRTEGGDFFAAATFPVGKAYITLVNGGWGGNITGLSSLNGMDASENETTCSIKYEDKTWYRFRVHVTGRAIRCWVDDKEIIAVDYQDRRVSTRLETARERAAGLRHLEDRRRLRKIEIRTLTPDEVAAANKSVR